MLASGQWKGCCEYRNTSGPVSQCTSHQPSRTSVDTNGQLNCKWSLFRLVRNSISLLMATLAQIRIHLLHRSVMAIGNRSSTVSLSFCPCSLCGTLFASLCLSSAQFKVCLPKTECVRLWRDEQRVCCLSAGF